MFFILELSMPAHTYLFCPDFNAGIGLVRMMGTTNYLALVGGGRSPKFAMNKASLLRTHQTQPLCILTLHRP